MTVIVEIEVRSEDQAREIYCQILKAQKQLNNAVAEQNMGLIGKNSAWLEVGLSRLNARLPEWVKTDPVTGEPLDGNEVNKPPAP